MSAQRILKVIGRIYQGHHLKRLRTLSILVSALVTGGKVGVASMGRCKASLKVGSKFRETIHPWE